MPTLNYNTIRKTAKNHKIKLRFCIVERFIMLAIIKIWRNLCLKGELQ